MNRWVIAAALTASTVAGATVSATSGASNDGFQVVRLECAVRAADADAVADAADAEPVVHCRWSEPHVPPASCRPALATRRPGLGHGP